MPCPALTSRLVAVLLAGLALGLPAAWNGQPLWYPDTPTYLRGAEAGLQRVLGPGRLAPWLAPTPPQPPTGGADAAGTSPARARGLSSLEDKTVLAGRSVYYGTLLYAAHRAGSLAWAVAAQALAVAWLLVLVMQRLWGLPAWQAVAVAGALAVATPLGAFTGLLMPDVLAGVTVVAVAVLVLHWPALARGERVALAGLLLFALAAHASHLALGIGLGGLALALRRWHPVGPWLSVPGLAVVAGCLVAAVAAEAAFTLAVTRTLGVPPLRLPHLSARLIEAGPGTAFLRRECPAIGYAACAFVGHYPTAWTDFLFSTDPQRGAFALADPATRRRMAQEQFALARDVVRDDPAGVAGRVGRDLFVQLALQRVDIAGYGPRELAMYEGRVPPATLAALRASRAAQGGHWNRALSVAGYASTLGALGLALAWGHRRRQGLPWPVPAGFARLALLVCAGVVINALVCATLAAPLDRFQARVAWLLPWLALCALALATRRRPAAAGPLTPHPLGVHP